MSLDGYRLGEAVALHVARASQHVGTAAQVDGGAMHTAVDGSRIGLDYAQTA